LKVLIAGGGTGGHINPGIAIAKYIKQKQPDSEIVFIGTKKGLETKLVPREGFLLKIITVRGFKRKLSLDTFVAVKEMFQGYLEARRIIKEFKPDFVIGTGGYVCGPVVFCASRMKIPTLIHEQNAFPGATNKILAGYVDAIAISFKDSRSYFKSAKRIVHSGNPVRSELLKPDKMSARKALGLGSDKQLVVIYGGSRGAERINSTVVQMVSDHLENNNFNMIFATGDAQYEKITGLLAGKKAGWLNVVPYIYDAGNTFAAADLMICRAGAIAISEMQVMGIPSILIPSPNVTSNHQEYNARALENDGGAVVILEKDLSAELLYQQTTNLLKDKEQLNKMAKNAGKNGITNAVEKIYETIKEIMENKRD
jgi:UDP-N-acetylglucosamine--N-acetylmuramyl-(pentapeptide) pyrophosphoryl-undecaprenol N-acetylglucosamine transferase